MTQKPFQTFRSKLLEEIKMNIKDLSACDTSTSSSQPARGESQLKSKAPTGASTETHEKS
ncbi:hypothetical protein D3C85_1830840 [compost metagenome]